MLINEGTFYILSTHYEPMFCSTSNDLYSHLNLNTRLPRSRKLRTKASCFNLVDVNAILLFKSAVYICRQIFYFGTVSHPSACYESAAEEDTEIGTFS